MPFSMVPLWLVNEVSARAIKTYCALFSFMNYRECYDKSTQTWGRPFAVISAHQAAERLRVVRGPHSGVV